MDSNFTFSPQHYCKEGYVERLSSNKIIGWKSIYLIVDRTYISWKKKNSDKLPKVTFPLAQIASLNNSGANEWIMVFLKLNFSIIFQIFKNFYFFQKNKIKLDNKQKNI